MGHFGVKSNEKAPKREVQGRVKVHHVRGRAAGRCWARLLPINSCKSFWQFTYLLSDIFQSMTEFSGSYHAEDSCSLSVLPQLTA